LLGAQTEAHAQSLVTTTKPVSTASRYADAHGEALALRVYTSHLLGAIRRWCCTAAATRR
jgi:hypothetical protein